jgi:hypothetical protein
MNNSQKSGFIKFERHWRSWVIILVFKNIRENKEEDTYIDTKNIINKSDKKLAYE